MKRLLLLGGSAQQVIAVTTAKRLGFYTVLCDYLTDNPGQYEADKFYLVSTTDKDAILEVARKEHIDGIIAYASDPAAPTAAFVAEKLGLPTNSYSSVMTLCNKDEFRKFLSLNGFFAPHFVCLTDADFDIDSVAEKISLPAIIKPVDSSGSKGVTKLADWTKVKEAADNALQYSRCHKLIIEEYLENKYEHIIGGDVFVYDGKVAIWGLMDCQRDHRTSSLVPVGKSYPLTIDFEDELLVKQELQRLMDCLEIKFGSFNVEIVVSKDKKVGFIDIGPRAGGNMIPDLLSNIFGIDMVEAAIKASMGCRVSLDHPSADAFYASHNLHTPVAGVFKDIEFSDKIQKYIIKKNIFKKTGDSVNCYTDASKVLGIILMKFDNRQEMDELLTNIYDEYSVVFED